MGSENKDCVHVLNLEICVGDIVDVSVGRHRIIGRVERIDKRYGVLIINDNGKSIAVRVVRIYMLSKIS